MVHRPHAVPEGLPPSLDVRQPPADSTRARGYLDLVSLLEEIGRSLDHGGPSRSLLRDWERRVIVHLREREVDQLMTLAGETERDAFRQAEQRWINLRRILLARKGIRA